MRTASCLILLLLFVSYPASATSYVPVTDEALVDQAPLIAVVKVKDTESGPENPRPSTVYRVRIEQVLKGTMAPGVVIPVRVPGGVRKDGIGLRIWGAPRFARGERAVLFLSLRHDGSYEIVHLMLGAFHEVTGAGHRLAIRRLSEAQAVVRPGQPLSQEPLRDFDRFVNWVSRRVRGMQTQADYEVAATPGVKQITDAFTLFKDADGYNMRWFEFDAGASVEWRAYQVGQEGVAGGGYTEFLTALNAWNDETGTNINYTYGGTTDSTNGMQIQDTINAILFNDPLNEIPGFSCGGGGILAWAGPWYDSSLLPSQGALYHPIVNADIVTNNGIACYLEIRSNPSKVAEELFGHELGHTLGIGHSCGGALGSCTNPLFNDALMRSTIHGDARGALLNLDDRAAAAALYTPPPVSTDFFTLTPCRLLDTRNPIGPLGGPALVAGLPRTFDAAGQCGIPSTAVSLSVNVTVVSPTASGFLTQYPADRIQPGTSSLNFSAGQTRAANAILLLSANPLQAFTVVLGVDGLGTAHLIVDVNGWFE